MPVNLSERLKISVKLSIVLHLINQNVIGILTTPTLLNFVSRFKVKSSNKELRDVFEQILYRHY